MDQPTVTRRTDAAAWSGRVEDEALLRGQGRFGDDVVPQGALFAHFVRSPHGFAKIKHVDVAAAKAAPGVIAVLTAADLEARALSFDLARPPDPRPRRQDRRFRRTARCWPTSRSCTSASRWRWWSRRAPRRRRTPPKKSSSTTSR